MKQKYRLGSRIEDSLIKSNLWLKWIRELCSHLTTQTYQPANQLESLLKPFFEWLLVLLLPEKWYIDKQTEVAIRTYAHDHTLCDSLVLRQLIWWLCFRVFGRGNWFKELNEKFLIPWLYNRRHYEITSEHKPTGFYSPKQKHFQTFLLHHAPCSLRISSIVAFNRF